MAPKRLLLLLLLVMLSLFMAAVVAGDDNCNATLEEFVEEYDKTPWTCQNRCGEGYSQQPCACDQLCLVYNDCCDDFKIFCSLAYITINDDDDDSFNTQEIEVLEEEKTSLHSDSFGIEDKTSTKATIRDSSNLFRSEYPSTTAVPQKTSRSSMLQGEGEEEEGGGGGGGGGGEGGGGEAILPMLLQGLSMKDLSKTKTQMTDDDLSNQKVKASEDNPPSDAGHQDNGTSESDSDLAGQRVKVEDSQPIASDAGNNPANSNNPDSDLAGQRFKVEDSQPIASDAGNNPANGNPEVTKTSRIFLKSNKMSPPLVDADASWVRNQTSTSNISLGQLLNTGSVVTGPGWCRAAPTPRALPVSPLLYGGRLVLQEEVVARCQTPLEMSEDEDVNRALPVTDAATGLHFANVYCSLCHGGRAEDALPWQLEFIWQLAQVKRRPDPHDVSLLLQLARALRVPTLAVPPSDVIARRCLPRDFFLEVQCPCPALQAACNASVDSYIRKSNIPRRSPACLLCSYLQQWGDQRPLHKDTVSPPNMEILVRRKNSFDFATTMRWLEQPFNRSSVQLHMSVVDARQAAFHWVDMSCSLHSLLQHAAPLPPSPSPPPAAAAAAATADLGDVGVENPSETTESYGVGDVGAENPSETTESYGVGDVGAENPSETTESYDVGDVGAENPAETTQSSHVRDVGADNFPETAQPSHIRDVVVENPPSATIATDVNAGYPQVSTRPSNVMSVDADYSPTTTRTSDLNNEGETGLHRTEDDLSSGEEGVLRVADSSDVKSDDTMTEESVQLAEEENDPSAPKFVDDDVGTNDAKQTKSSITDVEEDANGDVAPNSKAKNNIVATNVTNVTAEERNPNVANFEDKPDFRTGDAESDYDALDTIDVNSTNPSTEADRMAVVEEGIHSTVNHLHDQEEAKRAQESGQTLVADLTTLSPDIAVFQQSCQQNLCYWHFPRIDGLCRPDMKIVYVNLLMTSADDDLRHDAMSWVLEPLVSDTAMREIRLTAGSSALRWIPMLQSNFSQNFVAMETTAERQRNGCAWNVTVAMAMPDTNLLQPTDKAVLAKFTFDRVWHAMGEEMQDSSACVQYACVKVMPPPLTQRWFSVPKQFKDFPCVWNAGPLTSAASRLDLVSVKRPAAGVVLASVIAMMLAMSC